MKNFQTALMGNPNCGKSTLFNVLTRNDQIVANYPGVTVARKNGYFDYNHQRINIVDLPGIYSLMESGTESALDAQIARNTIIDEQIDVIINVVNATCLERHLYLTTQLLDLKIPVIIAVNMLDIAEKQGIKIDLLQLSNCFGCKVVGLTAVRGTGIPLLKEMIQQAVVPVASPLNYPKNLQKLIHKITILIQQACPKQKNIAYFLALRWLEGDKALKIPTSISYSLQNLQTDFEKKEQEETDLIIADVRYSLAHQASTLSLKKLSLPAKMTVTQRIDNIVLNRLWGIPIFLLVMYGLFFFAIQVGGLLQPFFDQLSAYIFVTGANEWLTAWHMPAMLTTVLTVGLGSGINTIATFIPVISCLFLGLSVLESSGYMARAAFVVDRIMRLLGLPGKAFVPLIVGFGCNVPAILATRTLEYRRDRLLTLMMTPFMSCGARLAIYAVFTAAFFPSSGQNIVFPLYTIGILAAVLTGLVLRKTILSGESSPWLVEMPTYHCPSINSLFKSAWRRLKLFIINAGRYILPVCFIISLLNAFNLKGELINVTNQSNSQSILAIASQQITPIFSPMGITPDNWPATVGLVSGILAKEVVVGTLNTLYTQQPISLLNTTLNNPFNTELPIFIKDKFQLVVDGINTISINQSIGFEDGFLPSIIDKMDKKNNDNSAIGTMVRYFDGQIGAISYLLFVLLYFPCISATAALAQESNHRWALYSVLWSTALAYIVAVTFYQTATLSKHALTSLAWIVGLNTILVGAIGVMRFYALYRRNRFVSSQITKESNTNHRLLRNSL